MLEKPAIFCFENFADGSPPAGRTYMDALAALEELAGCEEEFAIICSRDLAETAASAPVELYGDSDLSHAGLLLGGKGKFELAMLSCLNWLLLDPAEDTRCSSWRATASLCMIRPRILRALGGFDSAYESGDARLMDFGFRLISAGGRAMHDPAWVSDRIQSNTTDGVPAVDEYVFLLRHIGRFHAVWAAAWSFLAGRSVLKSWRALFEAFKRVKRFPAPPKAPVEGMRLLAESRRQKVGSITAIVPTLNRYDYVQQSICSLLRQNPRPDEIIVVDQTAESRRHPEVYAPFVGPGFRVIYQDRPGQSTSRNEAIRQAKGDWCLLWEDDTEAWDDLLEQHVQAMEYSGADASTGVSLAPWKTVDYIPVTKRHLQIADVFATGNALVRRSALLDVGGLDNAFNRGSGADHDLGVRLYLSGKEIIFNPRAVETHHKAITGGMRTYGAWWRNSGTWLSPFPPPTQVYTVRRYYPRAFRLPLYLLHYWTATKKHKSFELFWLWLSTPWKLWRAMREADKLQTEFGLEQASPIQP